MTTVTPVAGRTEQDVAVPVPVTQDHPRSRERKRDDYSHCAPLFAELAALPEGHAGRARLRERLIIEFLPLADHIATRFSGRGQPRDDLVQVARLGVMKAVDRFDPTHGADFLSFAVPTVMGEVRRHFRDTGWALRVPRGLQELQGRLSRGTTELAQHLGRAPTPSELAGHLGIDVETVRDGLLAANCYETSSLDQPLNNGEGSSSLAEVMGEPDAGIGFVEDHHTLVPLLKKLPAREQAIVRMRFFEGLSQSQIAARVGVSQMQVSRLLAKTLHQLRDQLDG